MERENNSTSAKVVTALIIGLIIGFGSGAFWQERRLESAIAEDTASAVEKKEESVAAKKTGTIQAAAVGAGARKEDGATGATGGSQEVMVNDQAAGSVVLISQAVSAEPVWVAVREEKDGGLGNILGAAKIPGGTTVSVAVELLRPTSAGRKYFVVLYRDVGEAAFNYREDVLIEGVQGAFTAR